MLGSDGRNLCPDRPALAVTGEIKRPSIDETKTVAELVRMSAERRSPDAVVPRHGTRPAGLTRAQVTSRTTLHVGGRYTGNTRRTCLGVNRVEVQVSLVEHEVFVARDATRPGTCERDVVNEHENRHVAINLDFVEDARARIAEALAPKLPELPWMEGYDLKPEQVSPRYLEILSPVVTAAFQAAATRARERHAEMDTEEAYRRDWSRCARPRA
ncbi:MAG: hypothetical protein NBV67_18370 [Tagaea sp.]|nr:hypothetical protein [Tagaea sp.]